MKIIKTSYKKTNDKQKCWSVGQLELSKKSYMELRLAIKKLVEEFVERDKRESKIINKCDLSEIGFLFSTQPISIKELYPI